MVPLVVAKAWTGQRSGVQGNLVKSDQGPLAEGFLKRFCSITSVNGKELSRSGHSSSKSEALDPSLPFLKENRNGRICSHNCLCAYNSLTADYLYDKILLFLSLV